MANSEAEDLQAAQDRFIEPMLCEPAKSVPRGAEWIFEVKLDGFRIEAVRPAGEGVTLLTRNRNSLNRKFFYIADAISAFLPDDSVLDGELVALDDRGRPSFNLLQFFRKEAERVRYCAFDLLRLSGRDLTALPLTERKALLGEQVAGRSAQVPVVEWIDGASETDVAALLRRVREQGLEGVVAKQKGSAYEAGERSGAWIKHRFNHRLEFVVGGYVPGAHGFGALLVGFYRGSELLFVNRLQAGFTPELREQIFPLIRGSEIPECPFANLPQTVTSRWGGEGLNAEKMKACVWVRPERVLEVEFLEWSGETSLRHAKFAGVREDKDARSVVREL